VKELPQRILTGVIFLVIVIGAIMINPITLATIFYIIAILGLLEYYSLCKIGGVHPQGTLGVITSTALICPTRKLATEPGAVIQDKGF
jgi:CDP-diglyceride synthetase